MTSKRTQGTYVRGRTWGEIKMHVGDSEVGKEIKIRIVETGCEDDLCMVGVSVRLT